MDDSLPHLQLLIYPSEEKICMFCWRATKMTDVNKFTRHIVSDHCHFLDLTSVVFVKFIKQLLCDICMIDIVANIRRMWIFTLRWITISCNDNMKLYSHNVTWILTLISYIILKSTNLWLIKIWYWLKYIATITVLFYMMHNLKQGFSAGQVYKWRNNAHF